MDFNDKSERIIGGSEFKIEVIVEYLRTDNTLLCSIEKTYLVNFDDVAGIEMQLNIPYEAYIIHVLVKFDEAEMYENEILIANEIII